MNEPNTWQPRLKLVLGKGGLEESGPEALLQRARVLGAKRIGVKAMQGWLEMSLDGLDYDALPKLTQGISNWVAIEYPRPYAMVLHVKTEDVQTPSRVDVTPEMLLDLSGMGIGSALGAFIWLEPQDAAWAEKARSAFKEAVDRVRQTGVRG